MRADTRFAIAVSLAAGFAALASCNYHLPPSSQELTQTAAAEARAATLTRASMPTPTVSPTNTPVPPTVTTTPTPSPQPTATVACDDSSEFVSDVTIRDNTVMKPGQEFTKTWRLRNSGDCDWTTSFAAAFVDGSSMGGPPAVPLAVSVPPNGTVDISIDLTAPKTNGAYRGNFRMRDANEVAFGVVFYVQIFVGPTPTPTVAVYRSGEITIDNNGSVDFDAGASEGDPQRDLWVHYVSDSERDLEPKNGARLKKVSGAPSHDQCKGTSLRSSAVSFSDFTTGSYFCYKTSDGRYGRFKVGKIESDSVRFDFRTWK